MRWARWWPRRRWATGGACPASPALEHSAVPLLGGPDGPLRAVRRHRARGERARGLAASTRPSCSSSTPTWSTRDRTGVVIVDQHSAHERVLFEAVMAQLTGDGAPAQRLLLPLTRGADRRGAGCRRVARRAASPRGLRGRAVRRPGGRAARRAGAASALRRRRLLSRARGRPGAGAIRRLGQPARAVRGHLRLPGGGEGRRSRSTSRERRELLLRLFATELPPHDVHGRATIVQLPREELERRFGRR